MTVRIEVEYYLAGAYISTSPLEDTGTYCISLIGFAEDCDPPQMDGSCDCPTFESMKEKLTVVADKCEFRFQSKLVPPTSNPNDPECWKHWGTSKIEDRLGKSDLAIFLLPPKQCRNGWSLLINAVEAYWEDASVPKRATPLGLHVKGYSVDEYSFPVRSNGSIFYFKGDNEKLEERVRTAAGKRDKSILKDKSKLRELYN